MERILFVDDEEKFLNLYMKKFSGKYDVDTAQDAKSAMKKINEKSNYAVIIADMCMPGINGIEFLEKVKETCPDSIRVMITGKGDMDIAVQAINRGKIFHFLTKPCTKEEMKSTLEIGIEKYRETLNLKRKSMYDELTKVFNRHYFEMTMSEIFNKSNRATDKFSLIFIDVNNLKDINDEFGHSTGDQLIIATSQVLKEMIRGDDFVARFGGDEFVIYANKTDIIGAASLIKRIKDDLKHRKLKHCSMVKMSIAAGIATFPEDGKTYQSLLKTADERMYLDKKLEKVINPDLRRKTKTTV